MSADMADTERRRELRQAVLVGLVLVVLTVAIEGALLGRHVYALWKHGIGLLTLAQNPASVLQPGAPARLAADLRGVEQGLRALRAGLRPVLRPVWLPWQAGRENMLTADALLGVGAELAAAGQVASKGLQSVVDAVEARQLAQASMSEALFTGLLGARPYLAEAAPYVGQAAEAVAALPTARLWGPLPRLVPTLVYYLRLGHAALEAAAAAPVLLGEGEPANYLVLAQNNDELRATGGFITGIGLVTLERGKIGDLVIKDSYDFDKFTVEHPWPPEPMTRYMGIEQWVTRDGNWSPDFPTAAQDVEGLYRLENSTEIHGVVAFDMLALQALVKAIGPLYLAEYQDQITGDNVLQKAREYWAPTVPEGKDLREWLDEQGWQQVKEDWWVHRKDFMGLLAGAIMATLQDSMGTEQMGGLLWTVKQAIDERHILLYFHEPAVQDLLAKAGMDGTLGHRTQGDYLLVVDTNMGYNKVNLNVDRLMEYEVSLAREDAPQASLTITYHNRSPAQAGCVHKPRIAATYEGMARDCYWNYLRVYAPLGSQLLSAQGVTETETIREEYGKTAFASFFVVPAAESRTVRFTYRLPKLDEEEYRLQVQKQAGTDALPITVRVTLSEGDAVLSSDPEPQSERGSVLTYDLRLRQDRSLVLKLR